MSTRVYSIDLDGTIRGLYSDSLPLAELGRLEVTRASNVEWNATCQQWEVTFTGETLPAFRHPNRGKCLEWEVMTLNERIKVKE